MIRANDFYYFHRCAERRAAGDFRLTSVGGDCNTEAGQGSVPVSSGVCGVVRVSLSHWVVFSFYSTGKIVRGGIESESGATDAPDLANLFGDRPNYC